MSSILRILLLIASLGTAFLICHKIRKSKVRQEDAAFWLVFAIILAILGIFPRVTYALCDLLGIMSPANLVYLVIIGLLLEKLLSLSIQISTMENKMEVMAAEIALRSENTEEQIKELDKEEKHE
ncbi:MAG: DUF2304 domain-containing protein [Lachnospiraceae bacterium]|nr:DUF2304 domain-containing protein [Lachnospiraceae bacterium]